MTASVKALIGPLRVQSDSGLHAPILSATNGTSKALAASVAALVALGIPETEAKKMVGVT